MALKGQKITGDQSLDSIKILKFNKNTFATQN